MRDKYKLGHNAPKGYVNNNFNSIEIEGDLSYCKSHNFMYDSKVEEDKLYNGLPCYYTDNRFADGNFNFYRNAHLHWTRHKNISLKACIKKTMKCKNIPRGTIVQFNKSWYYSGKKINNSFYFKVKKENKLDIEFEINKKGYSRNFSTCEFSQKLTDALRANGFIVSVNQNTNFILGMINTATAFTGSSDFTDEKINGEIAVAYGYGKRIGFSSYDDDFMGYSNGCSNVLWDYFGEFDKWSRCNELAKTLSIEEMIEVLKEPNDEN